MKYNLSNIARRANALARTMDKSNAWKLAWAEEKVAQLKEAEFILQMNDRWSQEDFMQSSCLDREIRKQYRRINELKQLAAQANAQLAA